jgi:hypothetical protein
VPDTSQYIKWVMGSRAGNSRNQILMRVSQEDLGRLRPEFSDIALTQTAHLRTREKIDYAYFPESGLILWSSSSMTEASSKV